METTAFNGWQNNVRLTNGEVELIITKDVGPRVIRFGFVRGENVFAEIAGQQGGSGESEWMVRGGHRLWIAPEEEPKTYELDNSPIDVEEIPDGVVTVQPTGPLSGVSKAMRITLAADANRVTLAHTLTNASTETISAAPWALSVMAADGMAVIPLPEKVPHTERLTHNQEWSLWGYTDLSDPRWTLGSRFLFFRQDRSLGPNKIGLAHREGWAAYLLDDLVFIKYFARKENAEYPDGGVNLETFSNEEILELESLGALVDLQPGATASHEEIWTLHRDVPACETEADVQANILPLLLRERGSQRCDLLRF